MSAHRIENQEGIEVRVFYPKQKAPTDLQNGILEGYVRDVVSHCSEADLTMRFFGRPNVEAIPGKITGRLPDSYEQPRDMVMVAFERGEPVGYADISRFSRQHDAAEFSILIRTDRQRRGIGMAMMQETVRAVRAGGILQMVAYIHPDNFKMRGAFQKWSRAEELQDVLFRKTFQDGEIVLVIDLGPILRKVTSRAK